MENKIKALLIALNGEYTEEDMEEVTYQYDNVFSIFGDDYLVLTDKEADEAVAEYIQEVIFSFRPSFLAECTGMSECVFESLCELYEEGNEAILSIINSTCGIEKVVSEAVLWDGRGHFLSSYNGEELEAEVEDGFNYRYYYAYRL